MSLGAFGDARGTGIGNEYMALRTGQPGTSGWATHAITPGDIEPASLLETLVALLEPRYMGEFAPDLGKGVFLSTNAPLTSGAPDTTELPNLYLRTDVRSAGAGSYRLISGCPGCTGPLPSDPSAAPQFAGASSDFSHLIFESSEPLTNDTAGCTPTFFAVVCPPHLYEWTNGVVRLAGLLPASQGGGAADNSEAGRGASGTGGHGNYTPDTISQDGSRIIFTVATSPPDDAGRLYMRVNNGEPGAFSVQLNASERMVPDAVPADATFWGASADGSKVLFTTNENLVDSDNTSEGNADLYLYDINAPVGHHLTLLSTDNVGAGSDVKGVLAATRDTRTVYFAAVSQIVSGVPVTCDATLPCIFRWHDGTVQYVAKVTSTSLDRLISQTNGWLTAPLTSRVSADGSKLLFVSQGTDALPHTGAGDSCSDGCDELFLYDVNGNNGRGPIVCASCAQPDGPAEHSSTFLEREGSGAASLTSHLPHALSADGSLVFFETSDPLVAADQDGGAQDVYEYDDATGQFHLLSSGTPGSFGATFVDASADGSNVFLTTRDQLSPWDTDDNVDLYDVRVNGGIPGPAPVPAECGSDACRPTAQGGAPALSEPASTSLHSAGNVKTAKKPAAHRCARGKVRKRVHGKVRCVKKTAKHKVKAKRAVKHAAGHGTGRWPR